MTSCRIGTRVVRGPDWHFQDEDGGEGCVGTVVEIRAGDPDTSSGKATEEAQNSEQAPAGHVVQWDTGGRRTYESSEVKGYRNLRIYDTFTAGT